MVNQPSVSCLRLPEWMSGTLREVVIFKLIRSYYHQSFNRYSWVSCGTEISRTSSTTLTRP
ncbi:hypothetical protein V8C44DRAFT_333584 [Trichoderma aethiopicum]